MITLLLACIGDPSLTQETPAPSDAATVPVQARDHTRYVRASVLKLREGPSQEAKVLGRLDINSPLALLGSDGGFALVKAANGAEGWVAAAYLDRSPLTVEQALSRAEADPVQTLEWLQRAAALDPANKEVLRRLELAYTEAGDSARAGIVARQLRWPEGMHLIRGVRGAGLREPGPRDDAWWIEVADLSFEACDPDAKWQGDGCPLRPGLTEELGVSVGQRWWVLPDTGPAVAADVREVRGILVNDCGGTIGVMLRVAPNLPPGATPWLATAAEPPTTWRSGDDAQRFTAEREAVAEAARDWAVGQGAADPWLSATWLHGDWQLDLRTHTPLPEPRMVTLDELEGPELVATHVEQRVLRWNGGDPQTISETVWDSHVTGPWRPPPLRDIDGDGLPDHLSSDGECNLSVIDAFGVTQVSVETTCCGC